MAKFNGRDIMLIGCLLGGGTSSSDIQMYATKVDSGGDECPEIATEAYDPFTIPAPIYEGQREPQVGDYLVWDFDVANASGFKQILCEITSLDSRGEPYLYGVYMRAICFMAADSGGSSENKLALVVGTQSADNLYDITASDLEGVTGIKQYTFYKGTGLRSIELPTTCTIVEKNAFSTCDNLERVSMPNVTSIGDSVCEYAYKLTSLSIPSAITIGGSAFRMCTALTSVSMPNVTTFEGQQVFMGCTALTSVSMPNVTNLSTKSFYQCSNLETISMPNVTRIYGSVFQSCSKLTSLTIPSTCISIGAYALYCGLSSNKCTFTFEGTTPPSIQSNTFTASNINKIIVPQGCLEAYQTATNWSNFASYIEEATA